MPKVVDARTRREDVADAVFRIAVREGLHRASLRTVAAEAGLNVGSVRHYFDDQSALMRFAMRAMIDRVRTRLEARVRAVGDPASLSPEQRRAHRVQVLGELLPLDDVRRAEITVFLEFTAAARTDPQLAPLAREAATGTSVLVGRVLAALVEEPERELQVARLAALLDGLSRLGVQQPDMMTARRCREVLAAHLDELERSSALRPQAPPSRPTPA